MDILLLSKILSWVPLREELANKATFADVEGIVAERKQYLLNEGKKAEDYIWMVCAPLGSDVLFYTRYTIVANEYISDIDIYYYDETKGEVYVHHWSSTDYQADHNMDFIYHDNYYVNVYGYECSPNEHKTDIITNSAIEHALMKIKSSVTLPTYNLTRLTNTGEIQTYLPNSLFYPIGIHPDIWNNIIPTIHYKVYVDIAFQLNALAARGYWTYASRNLLDIQHTTHKDDMVSSKLAKYIDAVVNGSKVYDFSKVYDLYTLYPDGSVLVHTNLDSITSELIKSNILTQRK